jgi:hypothetical protein
VCVANEQPFFRYFSPPFTEAQRWGRRDGVRAGANSAYTED